MKTSAKLATLFATGSLLAVGAVPAFATSPMSRAFVANVVPNVDFLNDSSRMALTTSSSPAVRAFARGEATEQTITGNSLVAWTETNTPRGEATALGTDPLFAPLAPIGGLVAAPLDVATNVTTGITNGVGDVLTGRSVALDNPLMALSPRPVAVPPKQSADVGVLPSGQTDLSRLANLKGRRFDTLYRSTQTDALRQLATVYSDYLRNGDDPALRAIASRELPVVQHRLGELHSL